MNIDRQNRLIVASFCLILGLVLWGTDENVKTTCLNGVCWKHQLNQDGQTRSLMGVESVPESQHEGLPRRLLVPAFLDGRLLTGIGREAFRGCTNLEEVVLPAATSVFVEHFDSDGLVFVIKFSHFRFLLFGLFPFL